MKNTRKMTGGVRRLELWKQYTLTSEKKERRCSERLYRLFLPRFCLLEGTAETENSGALQTSDY